MRMAFSPENLKRNLMTWAKKEFAFIHEGTKLIFLLEIVKLKKGQGRAATLQTLCLEYTFGCHKSLRRGNADSSVHR